LKAEAASAAIGKLLKDKHPGVRRSAAEALKQIKAESARDRSQE
jgi:HEAT repeat protein